MTIALSLKVHDGVVLATDSASTLVQSDGQGGTSVTNVYNSANKLFNLVKGWPIGATTWGAGSIGSASIATLAKDLRQRLSGRDPSRYEWKLDPESYTMEQVAVLAKRFLYDECYVSQHGPTVPGTTPQLGFSIAGYSAKAALAEVWLIEMGGGKDAEPVLRAGSEACGLEWHGMPEAISRLVNGYGTGMGEVLEDLGVPSQEVRPALDAMRAKLRAQLYVPPMPIQDAIDLAAYLVDATIGFMRFSPGATTVAGPVDIAAITKHEGFKWVQRKFYYQGSLNPEDQR